MTQTATVNRPENIQKNRTNYQIFLNAESYIKDSRMSECQDIGLVRVELLENYLNDDRQVLKHHLRTWSIFLNIKVLQIHRLMLS